MAEPKEVSLNVGGEILRANKDVLCKKSDYFRAMFSGNYAENCKQEISIEVVDAESMKIILQYMNTGFTNLSVYQISVIGKLVTAANFLNLTELIDRIKSFIESQEILPENCLEVMNIAQNPAFDDDARMKEFEQRAAKYALQSFTCMEPEYIPDIFTLGWYLSHHIMIMIKRNGVGDDALFIILGCLDVAKLTFNDSYKMRTSSLFHRGSLAAKIVDCLHNLAEMELDLSEKSLQIMQGDISERVHHEILLLLKESKQKSPSYTPVMLAKNKKKLEFFTFAKTGFTKWIECPESFHSFCNNSYIQDVVMPWGHTKMVIIFKSEEKIMVYNVVEKTWTSHSELDLCLSKHFYDGFIVLGNSLYLIAKSGDKNVFTTSIYDLKEQVFTKIAKSSKRFARHNIAVCVHKGTIYAFAQSKILAYDSGSKDCWKSVVETEFDVTHMVSFKSYIYCLDDDIVYRFQPGVDEKLLMVTKLTTKPSTVCNLGRRLIFFSTTSTGFFEDSYEDVIVEDYNGDNPKGKPRLLVKEQSNIKVQDVISCCPLLLNIPSGHEISKYVSERLKKYEILK